MINSYDQEHLASQKGKRLFRIAYLINVGAAIISLLSPLNVWHRLVAESSLVPGILGAVMLANLWILCAHADWRRLKRHPGFRLTWFIIAVLRLALSFTRKVTLSGNYHNVTGYVNGMVVGSIIAALCLTCVIWLYPQFKKRRN